jgi:hypothetical protein
MQAAECSAGVEPTTGRSSSSQRRNFWRSLFTDFRYTVVSSMTGATDHIEHIRWQRPFRLLAGVAALVLYLLAVLVV